MNPLFAVITHNVVSMRAEPKSSAEQVSQTILGTGVLLLEGDARYVRIRTPDGYEGWVLREHLRACSAEDPYAGLDWYLRARRVVRVVAPFAEVRIKPEKEAALQTKLVWGTWVRVGKAHRKRDGVYSAVLLPTASAGEAGERIGYIRAESVAEPEALPAFSGKLACALARKFIGTPYLWGGTTPFGFDCSGFVQAIYGMLGVTIPRDADLQAESSLGSPVLEEKPMRAGDLVFFCGSSNPHSRAISHVGMALDNAEVIHAYGRNGVSIDSMEALLTTHDYAFRGAWRYKKQFDKR